MPLIFRLGLKENQEIRDEVATAQDFEQFRSCVNRLKAKFEPYHLGQSVYVNADEEQTDYNLALPPWICQQYIRMAPEKHIAFLAEKERNAAEREQFDYFDDDGNKISKNGFKRLKKANRKAQKRSEKANRSTRFTELCNGIKCANPTVRRQDDFEFHAYHTNDVFSHFYPQGSKCDHKMCRQCCRDKCQSDSVACVGHKFSIEPVKRKTKCQHLINTENVQPD